MNRKIDFITKEHLKKLNMEITHELIFFDYEDEFTSLQDKFIDENINNKTKQFKI
ncbi:hypothetical protein [Tepidibacter thalassicus]|uniref:Uncharacterized protein n=1 Tax=Tepidibacter thalassicus DSM 15285 TaxID=1123350 RepID=A0A1M5NYA6_9FIRM|nr:hypothetical protein [Tepidibacter thalassicus]SHG94546.1 hypothetical protein SAMN02744040_00289 [Tepidibacter thalassicus DSM 15285]